jgi:hypothetical protein
VFKLKAPTSTSINAPNPRASSRDALEKTAPILYSVSEAAAKLCVAPKWLYERTRKNGVPCRRLGKYVRFSDADLAAIVANAFVPATGPTSVEIPERRPPTKTRLSGTCTEAYLSALLRSAEAPRRRVGPALGWWSGRLFLGGCLDGNGAVPGDGNCSIRGCFRLDSERIVGITGQSFENNDLLLPVFTVNSTFDAFTGTATAAA